MFYFFIFLLNEVFVLAGPPFLTAESALSILSAHAVALHVVECSDADYYPPLPGPVFTSPSQTVVTVSNLSGR